MTVSVCDNPKCFLHNHKTYQDSKIYYIPISYERIRAVERNPCGAIDENNNRILFTLCDQCICDQDIIDEVFKARSEEAS